MTRLVKQIVSDNLKHELDGDEQMNLVNVVGLSATRTTTLRRRLRQKNIQLRVVKNSLARRATEGTPLAGAFADPQGPLAVVWGAADMVTLAKEVVRLASDKDFEAFKARGGVMGGAALKPEEVEQISKWPTREEQLGILVHQILSPGAKLASQLSSAGAALASQIKQTAEGEPDETAAPAAESVP
jgi:ribosomal protein L10